MVHTPQPGLYPHIDEGVGVRPLFHRLRPQTIEPFNGLFKNIFEWRGQVPVKELNRVRLIVLDASYFISWSSCINWCCTQKIGLGNVVKFDLHKGGMQDNP